MISGGCGFDGRGKWFLELLVFKFHSDASYTLGALALFADDNSCYLTPCTAVFFVGLLKVSLDFGGSAAIEASRIILCNAAAAVL